VNMVRVLVVSKRRTTMVYRNTGMSDGARYAFFAAEHPRKDSAMAAIRRILLASDFSKSSRKAFTTATTLARSTRAALTILHVLAPIRPVSPYEYVGPQTWEQLDAQNRRWAKRQLTELTGKAKKAGVRAGALVTDGNPAAQIVRVAKAKRFDLVILGTHGRTGVARFFLGSVAGRVVATAGCPVLTVRGG
jgi:nucleotide-binding universal stress UspA family protein